MLYYNTTSEKPSAVRSSRKKAKRQNEAIFDFFRKHPGQEFTPEEVWINTNLPCPITSIRRAITTMCKKGMLIKTPKKRISRYGRPAYTWTIREA
jgi:hypothetical protein